MGVPLFKIFTDFLESLPVRKLVFIKCCLLLSLPQSYLPRDQNIVTQMPLPGTIPDIWRMIYDYNLRTIVMMNTLDSKDPVGCEMHHSSVITEGVG